MKKNLRNNKKSNQDGILTIDFLFSTVVVFAISMVFSVMAVTLMFSSVSQYVLFSSARAKVSSHLTLSDQEAMADAKFDELIKDKLKSFFEDSEWFELQQTNFHIDELDTIATASRGRRFYGTAATFVSKVLDFRIPMLGNTSDGLTSDEFSAPMSAFLYREPNTQECIDFNKERWRVLSEQFPSELRGGAFNLDTSAEYGSEADNGC